MSEVKQKVAVSRKLLHFKTWFSNYTKCSEKIKISLLEAAVDIHLNIILKLLCINVKLQCIIKYWHGMLHTVGSGNIKV